MINVVLLVKHPSTGIWPAPSKVSSQTLCKNRNSIKSLIECFPLYRHHRDIQHVRPAVFSWNIALNPTLSPFLRNSGQSFGCMLTNSIYRIETIWINRMIKGQQFLIGETCIQIVCRSDSLYHEDFIVSWLAIRFEFGVRSTVDFQAEFLVGHLWYNLSMNNMSLTQKSMAALAY